MLVNVTSGGPSALDLKLLATEGESPYYLNSEFLMRMLLAAADQ